MSGRLELDLGEMGNRIFAALGHLSELLEHKAVEVFRRRLADSKRENGGANAACCKYPDHLG